ncbi:hypothetical protein IJ384_02505 [bacterium]|nr:hypothetical protein [bacterium]
MIHPVSANTSIYFRNNPQVKQAKKVSSDENPISRKGEAMKLVTATFLGGLALAGKLIFELADDGDFLLDIFAEKAKKMTNDGAEKIDKESLINEVKNEAKKEIKNKKVLNTIGAFAALVATFFAGFALLYTAFHAPKIAYESKVNTFKKSKEMDVYIKSNEAERELYTQLDKKAKQSNSNDKKQLQEQYLKLKNAKNEVPDFVNLKLK